MLGYIAIILLIVSGAFISDLNQVDKKKKTFTILVFGSIFLYAALRNETVGIDHWNRYVHEQIIFRWDAEQLLSFLKGESSLLNLSLEEGIGERGYYAIIWFVSRLIPSSHFIGMIWDGFIIYSFGRFFYKYSSDIVTSSLMYMCFVFAFEMNVTRQFIAAAILLWIFEALMSKKYKRAVLLFILAFLFHDAAMLMLIAFIPFVLKIEITPSKFTLLVLCTVAGFFLFDFITILFTRYFPQYTNYLTSEWAVGDVEFSFKWLAIYLLIISCLFLYIHKNKKHNDLNNDLERKTFNFISYNFVLYAAIDLLKSEIWFISRINIFFLFAYCMVVSFVVSKTPYFTKKSLFVIRMMVIVVLVIWGVSVFENNGHGILPYEFFWE